MKIAFYTLGCKVNQYESQAMSETMADNGFVIVPPDENADIYVINSCTVTSESDRKTRQAVRRFKKNHPDSIVVLTGCMPQAFPDDAQALSQADIVIGNHNNYRLFDYVSRYLGCNQRIVEIEPHESGDKFSGGVVSKFGKRTRAIVKIEDGCNRFCSYCIIPYSRGRVRSKSLDDLKTELISLKNAGYAEVVLVGINLSSYGSDIGLNLADAVELASDMGFARIRLGSLEPDHMNDGIMERLAKLDNFCPQFHIALQSGCNKTLKAMNRHYTAEEYLELCNRIRKNFKDSTITTDIMVGFPTETYEDFCESVDFTKKVNFEKVHVFPYSPREGTKAAEMEQVEKCIKEKRSHLMIEETEKQRHAFLTGQIGRQVDVLFETRHVNGYTEGYTMNYTPVKVKGEMPCGEIIKVKITAVDGDFCIAERE